MNIQKLGFTRTMFYFRGKMNPFILLYRVIKNKLGQVRKWSLPGPSKRKQQALPRSHELLTKQHSSISQKT